MSIVEFTNKKETKDIVDIELNKKLGFIYNELRKMREKIADLENMKQPKQFLELRK